MILSPEQIALIKDRRKTQLRMPADMDPPKVGELYKIRPKGGTNFPTKTGTYPVYAPLEITVVWVRDETLGDTPGAALPKLGFRFMKEFEAAWKQKYPWLPDMRIWVVDFVVGDLRDRFDKPRLLKATPGKAGDEVEEHQDYTTRWALAAANEPEALTEAQMKPYTQDAHTRDDLRARMEAATKPRNARLRQIEDRARDGDSEAQRALWLIDQKLQAAERKRARRTKEEK